MLAAASDLLLIPCCYHGLASLQVADFGLAVKMDHMETHLSNAFQVRHFNDLRGDQGAELLLLAHMTDNWKTS